MGKFLLLFVSLLLFTGASATELVAGNFKFDLEGTWDISENSGTTTAVEDKTNKAFIISIYYPNSIGEGAKMLASMKSYLSNLETQNPGLREVHSMNRLAMEGIPPWELVSYEDSVSKGYFIGACLGSSAGLIMITFEGRSSVSEGVNQLKEILSSMEYIET